MEFVPTDDVAILLDRVKATMGAPIELYLDGELLETGALEYSDHL